MKNAKLNRNYFDHQIGEIIEVLEFRGNGRYYVKFANGETDMIGKSSFTLV